MSVWWLALVEVRVSLRGRIIYSTDPETRQILAGLDIPSLPGAASG